MTTKEQKREELRAKIGKPRIIFVSGGPCSGKTKVARFLESSHEFTYISTGELLRQEILKVS